MRRLLVPVIVFVSLAVVVVEGAVINEYVAAPLARAEQCDAARVTRAAAMKRHSEATDAWMAAGFDTPQPLRSQETWSFAKAASAAAVKACA